MRYSHDWGIGEQCTTEASMEEKFTLKHVHEAVGQLLERWPKLLNSYWSQHQLQFLAIQASPLYSLPQCMSVHLSDWKWGGLKTEKRISCILCSSKVHPYACFNQKWNGCRRVGRRVVVNLHLSRWFQIHCFSWCPDVRPSNSAASSLFLQHTPVKMYRGLIFNNGHSFVMSHWTLGSLPRLPLSSVIFLPAFPSFSSLFTPPSTLTCWLNSWWKAPTARDLFFQVFHLICLTPPLCDKTSVI